MQQSHFADDLTVWSPAAIVEKTCDEHFQGPLFSLLGEHWASAFWRILEVCVRAGHQNPFMFSYCVRFIALLGVAEGFRKRKVCVGREGGGEVASAHLPRRL